MPISRECDIDPGFDPLRLATPTVAIEPKPIPTGQRMLDIFLERAAAAGGATLDDLKAAGFSAAEIETHHEAAAVRAARILLGARRAPRRALGRST